MIGKIIDIRGNFGSGIAILTVLTEGKRRLSIQCENAPTVRALDDCFGGVIGPGHTIRLDAIRGRWIEFDVDDIGMLEWIRAHPDC